MGNRTTKSKLSRDTMRFLVTNTQFDQTMIEVG